MSIKCTNLKRFTRSLRAVGQVTRKTETEIVNRAARDVAFRAMSFTPKTTAANISADVLGKDKLLLKLATIRIKRGNAGKTKRGRVVKGYTKRGKARLGIGVWQQTVKNVAKAILGSRRSRAAAFRAGWIPAVQAMGGTVRGSVKPSSSAARGFGKKASRSSLVAHIRNAIVSINSRGARTPAGRIKTTAEALNRAILFVASDRENYVRKKQMLRAMKGALRG